MGLAVHRIQASQQFSVKSKTVILILDSSIINYLTNASAYRFSKRLK